MFMPTCKEAAALLIASEDQMITLSKHAKTRLPLLARKSCPTFERQLLTMRNAMQLRRNCATGGDWQAP